MDTRIEFLYLSEPDTIAAGVNNEQKCISSCEEVFGILAKGDYLMGGPNHNSHGMGIIFPKESPFPNMPVAGPDRRFFAMPAYLGGRYDTCGCKWYGSNAANTGKGLPRSILTMTLNDKDTGAPLSIMSANLLSAARTGAIPGVATKYLARKNSEVVAIIGCGPINQSCFRHLITQLDGVRKVYCYDLFTEKAKAVADSIASTYNVEAQMHDNLEEVLRESDVVTIAASRLKPLYFESAWIKKGATVMLTGPANSDPSFWTDNKIVLDHVGLHENYVSEAIESGDKEQYYSGVIGGPIYRLVDAGKLPPLDTFTSIGMIINGEKPGRVSDDETFVFVACGMAVFDVAIAYDLYEEAKKQGIGQKLLLWDTPNLG